MPIIRDIAPGDIYITQCTVIQKNKPKYHVFLEGGNFFLINTNYYYDSIKMAECDYNFLDHDSHLHHSVILKYPDNNSIDSNDKKGFLNIETIKELIKKVQDDEQLTPKQQRMVKLCLDNLLIKIQTP